MTQKILWIQCPRCKGLSDFDDEFACGAHHEGPYQRVLYSPHEILANPELIRQVRTKHLRPFFLELDS